jgi:hypothetical protein
MKNLQVFSLMIEYKQSNLWLMKASKCLAFVDDEGSTSLGAALQGTWF